MKTYYLILTLIGSLFLGGCAGLAGFAGAVGGVTSSAGLDAFKDQIAARAERVGKRQEIVSAIEIGMIGQAEIKKMEGDYACWRQIMDDVLAFQDLQKPLFLIEKAVKKRAESKPEPAPESPTRKDCSSRPAE